MSEYEIERDALAWLILDSEWWAVKASRIADAILAAGYRRQPEPREAEYGVRADGSGAVIQGGPGWDHLVRSDPKDYPGFTLVTRMCGEWEAFAPNAEVTP